MKIIEINSVCRGSTGKIMLGTASYARAQGHTVYTFSRKKKEASPCDGHAFFGLQAENMLSRAVSIFSGYSENGSILGTLRLIREIKRIQPDVLHLHNLHGWYLNLPMLTAYIRKHNIPVVWTLHDCWGFTAQCSHFTIEKCDKWQTQCHDCPRYRIYPYTYVDRTQQMYRLKRKWMTGLPSLTVVTPSHWLAGLVRQSFLKEYPVEVIHNGIDLSVFQPTPSNFREEHGIEQKHIVLGVASGWTERKGLDVFVELSKRLDPQKYQIVLVGTDDTVDKQLPGNILSIHRTQNQTELAEIYTAADVFANPTKEEVLGLVNVESLACGTPVITFKSGGSPECIDETCGAVVECDDVASLESEICRMCESAPVDSKACIARAKKFDLRIMNKKYLSLYEKIGSQRGDK